MKSKGAGDRTNAAGLKVGLGGSIVDWPCFAPDALCERMVGGFADTGACISVVLPRKHACLGNTLCGERSKDLILAAARETMKEDGVPAQSYAERGRSVIMGGTSRHAFGAGPMPSQLLAKLHCHWSKG